MLAGMRTRFAPSPTGFLHVGGLRTALYAWLLARQTKGTFILRIEDTDQKREVEGAVEAILHALHWAGLDPEEGVVMEDGKIAQRGSKGPFIQSKRKELYAELAKKLLDAGHAYRCFCTPARLEEMRNGQMARKQAPMYDRACLKLPKEEVEKRVAAGEPHVIRMRVPDNETIVVEDEIRGTVSFQTHTVDDQVLVKSDGMPTYHLAHVVDDRHMGIDLVLRGEEWLSSLPKHVLLFRFFGWEPPRFAHVSLLLNKDKTKLSKRQNSVSVSEYVEKGYLPEAMLNFLAMLGWNPGTTQEVFSLPELIEQFSLERVQKAGAIFDLEKLDWLQGQWIRKLDRTHFADRIRALVAVAHPAAATDPGFADKAALIQDRITFFREAPDMLGWCYADPEPSLELLANPKQKVTPELLPDILATLHVTLAEVSDADWNDPSLLALLRTKGEEKGWKLGQILWPLRAACTGRPFSPGATEVAALLGKAATLRRLDAAMRVAKSA